MNIAFCYESVVPARGGCETYIADLARRLAKHDRVLSTGTLLDSLRFRVHVAERLGVSAASIEALVVGEHGTSEVLLWSSARVNGVPIADALPGGTSLDALRKYAEASRAFDLSGDYRRAAELLRQAVRLDTTFAMAYRKLGVALSNAGMPLAQTDSALTAAFRHRDRLPS